MRVRISWVVAITVLGCGSPTPSPSDSGSPGDAGSGTDAGRADSGLVDSGVPDAGAVDSGANDSGLQDSGALDAGSSDAGTPDSGSSDAGSADAGCTVIDCSNPACTGYACIPAVPAGWTGYVALFDGPSDAGPACPGTFPTTAYAGNDGLDAPPACNSSCACGAASGQQCAIGHALVSDAPCGQAATCGVILATPAPWDGSCYSGPYDAPGGFATCGANSNPPACTTGTAACNQSVQLLSAMVTGGACAPSGSSTPVPSSWAGAGVACGGQTAGIGCAGGASCQPVAAAPFQPGLCIYQAGVAPCPATAFTHQHILYGGVSDLRSCTACSCGGPGGGSCQATVQFFSAPAVNTCTGLVATLAVTTSAGACANLVGNPNVQSHSATFSTPVGGSCGVSGGLPSGTAVGTNPVTFCCVP